MFALRISDSGMNPMRPLRRRVSATKSRRSTPERDTGHPPEPRTEYVQALKRGFDVILAFSVEAPVLTIADVAHRTGLTRAAARRYLFTLRDMGCVRQIQGAFALTARLLDLGFAYLSSLGLPAIAEPYMEGVVNLLHESCSMSVLEGRDIVYVARMPAKRIMSINLVVGSRLPAHATSMGKVLLAHIPPAELDAFFAAGPLEALSQHTTCDEGTLREILTKVRIQGWALANSESEEGVRSVAAPIRDRNDRVTAAINVSGHASRVSAAELRRVHLPVLLKAAAGISASMKSIS
jgi:IclR family pca regulon transcriptional regulator